MFQKIFSVKVLKRIEEGELNQIRVQERLNICIQHLRVFQTQAISFLNINVKKNRIRHRTTLNLNNVNFNRF